MKYSDEAFPNIPFSHSAYDVETKGMSHEEKGVYMDLMILVWRRKCQPIPDSDEKISRMIGCTLDRWKRKLRPAVEPLFIVSEEGWRHERMEQRWAGIEEKSAIAAQKGRLGGRPPNRQTASTFPNPLTDNAAVIYQTQTANPLENKEIEKAVAFDQVKPDESYKIESKIEESKKEPPLSPPMGGMVGEDQVQPSQPITAVQPPDRMLFPVQEVSTSRRKRNAPVASPEVEAAFVEFKAAYPRRNNPHTWTLAKPLFVAAVNSGVPAETLIRTAGMYARTMKAEGKVGTSVVADARTWLSQSRWENYADFQPVHPKMNGSNVTPLRNGTTHQPPQTAIRRGGLTY